MITIKTQAEIEIMTMAGRILSAVMQQVSTATVEGITLLELDHLAERLTRLAGAIPGFLGYQPHGAGKPYPATICASINEIVVHGVPTKYKLRSGDLLKLDFGVELNGYYADAAVTIPIGIISKQAQHLVNTTRQALMSGIKQMRIGNSLGDIGHAIEFIVKSRGFHVVEGLTGHGIGRELHEDPSVFNTGKIGSGPKLIEGMVLAIEPMVAVGTSKIIKLHDDSYATADGSLSAHFEHTVAITKDGPVILT